MRTNAMSTLPMHPFPAVRGDEVIAGFCYCLSQACAARSLSNRWLISFAFRASSIHPSCLILNVSHRVPIPLSLNQFRA